MKFFTFLISFIFLTFNGAHAQAPNNGFYVNSVEEDVFKFPNSTNINETTINNRTFETYFYANATTSRQFIFMEGNDDRGVLAYIENDYLIVGAYNIDTGDYTNIWNGTYFRKAISASTWYHVALVFDNLPVPAPAPAPPVTENDNAALKWYLDGVLQDEKAGFQIGGSGDHKELFVGFKNDKLYFPTCGTWTSSGLSEYCFGNTINEDGGNENYFDGYIWGFRVWDDVRTLTEIDTNKDKLLLSVNSDDLMVALDGDTMTFLEDDVLTDQDSDSPPSVKEWEGDVDTDWTNTANWKNGEIPDNAKQEPVLITRQSTNYPVLTTTVVTGDIELEFHATEPGTITIQDGGTLDVAYDVLNDGTIALQNNGSLYVRESKPITGVGDFSIVRDSPNYPSNDFYSVWSTPVAETDSEIGSIFTNAIITYKYDASQTPSAYVQVGNTENMEVGRGYFIRSDNDSGVISRTFSGSLNNGDFDEPIYHNSPTDNFNLIGNPYSSAIDWVTFQEDNSDLLGGTMYYWSQSFAGENNSTSDYISFNSLGSSEPGTTGDIAAGQGIFVKSSQVGTATFKNSHRVSGNNNQFFRSNEDDGKSWFRLSGSMGYSPILIGFIPGATDDYDDMYDAAFISEGATIELYSLMGTNKYEIQGRSVLEENQLIDIPLGYEVLSAGDYTISIVLEYIDPTFDIFLEDTLLNITTDLRTLDYTFNVASATEDNGRFILHYEYNELLSADEFVEESNSINSSFVENELVTKIFSNETPNNIQLFNINGKEMLNDNYSDRIQINNLSSGIYIVKYIYEDSRIVSKKAVKK